MLKHGPVFEVSGMAAQDITFLEEVGDVRPLRQDGADVGKKIASSASIAVRRDAAVQEATQDNFLSTTAVPEVAPYDIVSFKRDGIQEGVFRNLRLGKYSCDGRLDLHRMTVEEARRAIYDFVRESMAFDLRTLLILHGKGDRKADQKAILKSYAVHWLKQIPEVMAFHSAQPQHGGSGALYVLLRKSEEAKKLNRERHGVRS